MPEKAMPSMTRRCMMRNRMRTGAIASRLAASSSG
jgi:hypothetical protein